MELDFITFSNVHYCYRPGESKEVKNILSCFWHDKPHNFKDSCIFLPKMHLRAKASSSLASDTVLGSSINSVVASFIFENPKYFIPSSYNIPRTIVVIKLLSSNIIFFKTVCPLLSPVFDHELSQEVLKVTMRLGHLHHLPF